eukprot:12859608-Alexandrium_andersonii.AAC.1
MDDPHAPKCDFHADFLRGNPARANQMSMIELDMHLDSQYLAHMKSLRPFYRHPDTFQRSDGHSSSSTAMDVRGTLGGNLGNPGGDLGNPGGDLDMDMNILNERDRKRAWEKQLEDEVE